MHDATDMDLLRQYADGDSDAAFAVLVSRHVDLVFSAALRKTGNPHAAEEITQAVFIILAQKAGRIVDKTILPGWLYQTARLTASSYLRRETRRIRREQEAFMQTESQTIAPNETWQQLAPLLEDAMGQLGDKDRAAVVLRFFGGKSFAEVAMTAGVTENAAKKRVIHALEKLHRYFAKRGVSSTTAIIADAISTHSVQIAPVALAKAVTAIAVSKGVAAGGSTLALVKGALNIMAWAKAKTAIVTGVVVLLAAGTAATIAARKNQAPKMYSARNATVYIADFTAADLAPNAYSWQVPNADFAVIYKTPPQVAIVPTKFSKDGHCVFDRRVGVMGIAQSFETILLAAYQKDKLRTLVVGEWPPGKYDFFAKLTTGDFAKLARLQTGNLADLAKLRESDYMDTNWTVALQKEITRKFGFTGRLEQREMDVLLLKPFGAGPHGFTVSHPPFNRPMMFTFANPEPGKYSYKEESVSFLRRDLERYFNITILDQTGLTDTYDFAVKWNEPDPKQKNFEGLKQALRDQLGLELMSSRAPLEMLVLEKVK